MIGSSVSRKDVDYDNALFRLPSFFEGGLLSAYHLSGGEKGMNLTDRGPKPAVYLETAKNLAYCLLSAFTSSPTPIPFSDVILHEFSVHSALDDQKYSVEAMKVLDHMKS